MRLDTFLNEPGSDAPVSGCRIRPSKELRNLVRCYLTVVDNLNEQEHREVSERLQRAMMDSLRAEHIPFETPEQARWIARWIHSGEPVTQGKQTTIMFARTPENRHPGEYDPISDGVSELVSEPFSNEADERANADRFTPVVVTIEPLHEYKMVNRKRL